MVCLFQYSPVHGEGEVVVVRVIDEEAVVRVLLEAFRVITLGDERTGVTRVCAKFNPHRLTIIHSNCESQTR